MSQRAKALNFLLRYIEKRRLARATDVHALRHNFARRARLLFHGPRDTRFIWDSFGKVPVQWALARGVDRNRGPVILYFHGGGYILGSTTTHRAMLARLSQASGLPVCLVEYRLAPEHPFPAAFDDAMAAFGALTDRQVILGGDSAGGGLAMAVLGEVLRQDLPPPHAVFGFSPCTDLTFSGASILENANSEVMLPTARLHEISDAYLAGHSPDDPRASPLFAEFDGGPPVWLTVGSTEILRDDTLRLAERMRACGVDVTLKVEEDLPHIWPIFHNVLPEGMATLQSLAEWLTAQSG